MELETDLIIDQPRESDYMYEQLFGSGDSQDSREFLPPSIQNQGAKPKTRMGCGCYGICHAINAQNLAVSKVDGMRFYEIPAEGQWLRRIDVTPEAEKKGSTLQSWLDTMKELGYITGYSRVNTIAEMKDALNNTRPIYTGSLNCNWNTVRDDHIYSLGNGYAHIFCIVGYNKSWWIAINSYGPSNGVFYIPYEFTDSLFTRYALSDSRDADVFSKHI